MTRREELERLREVVKSLRALYEAEKALREACSADDPDRKARSASVVTARDCLLIAMDVLTDAERALIAQDGQE